VRLVKLADSSEQGSVAAEYGLLIVGIAVAIAAAAATLGGQIAALYNVVF